MAKGLLGQRLVRVHRGKRTAGIIVEAEAYLGVVDRAAHTFGGRRTDRNESMWRGGGHAYVYFTYGIHYLMNVVAGKTEQPVAVLIRALEPVEGFKTMHRRRKKARHDRDLCSGPAKLTQAMAIDRHLDSIDLVTSPKMFIEKLRGRAFSASHISAGPRVGIDYAGDWKDKPLRFYIKDNPYVS